MEWITASSLLNDFYSSNTILAFLKLISSVFVCFRVLTNYYVKEVKRIVLFLAIDEVSSRLLLGPLSLCVYS